MATRATELERMAEGGRGNGAGLKAMDTLCCVFTSTPSHSRTGAPTITQAGQRRTPKVRRGGGDREICRQALPAPSWRDAGISNSTFGRPALGLRSFSRRRDSTTAPLTAPRSRRKHDDYGHAHPSSRQRQSPLPLGIDATEAPELRHFLNGIYHTARRDLTISSLLRSIVLARVYAPSYSTW